MRHRTTKIESLGAKHPGLEKDVCRWLKSHLTGAEVAQRLRAKYHETVAPNTISSYRARRLDHVWESVKERKISYLGFMEAVGEEGLDAGAAAKLWEALQSMTPAELIAVRRLQLERERVGVLDKRAENEKQKLKARLKWADKSGGGEKKPPDPREIRRRIRAIYGLPDDSKPVDPTSVFALAARRHSDRGDPVESEPEESKSEVRSPESEEGKSVVR